MTEFFDQNPIGQMAIMVTRDGLAERLTPLSGAVSPLLPPQRHYKADSGEQSVTFKQVTRPTT